MPKAGRTVMIKRWKVETAFDRECDLDEGFTRISSMLRELDEFLATIPALGAGGKSDLRLVLDEISSNVVRYAAPMKRIGLEVEVEVRDDAVRMKIIDDGHEFNPFDQAVPYMGAELEERRVGGLGLYLISQLFPLASYKRRDGRNIAEVEYHMGVDGNDKMRRTS